MAINTVAIMGRLTYNPELKSTNTGISVTHFQVAVDRSYVPKGQEKQTDFIDCVAFRQTAEFVHRYFNKGSMIALDGSLQSRTYTDKNGNDRKVIEVFANNVSFCGGKKEEAKPNVSVTKEESSYDIIDDGNDKMPWD